MDPNKYIDIILDKYNELPVQEAFHILLKLFNNIVNNPLEDKFKYFKKTNKTIKAKVLIIPEIIDLLKSMGYIDVDDESMVYTENLDIIKNVSNKIKSITDIYDNKKLKEEEEKKQKLYEEKMEIIKQQTRLQQEEKEKIRRQLENDKKEREKRENIYSTKAKDLNFGATEFVVKCSGGGG